MSGYFKESKDENVYHGRGYDDPDFVEKKQQVDYAKEDCSVADDGDEFFPKQYYANPFPKKRGNGITIANFFREGWTAKSEYEKKLFGAANDLINDGGDTVPKNLMDYVMSGINPLHPFLEIGGALRTQVPLPTNMTELYSLISVILNDNPRNTDKYKMPEKGFKEAKEIKTAIAIEEGASTMLWQGEANAYVAARSILVWDDVAGSAGINEDHAAPNFIKLLGSIIFQRSDEIAYNARGQYLMA